LMDLPLDGYELLYTNKKGNDVLGHRTTKKCFGRNMTVVVQYNDATKRKMTHTYEREVERSLKALGKIQTQLEKPPGRGRPLTKQGLAKKVVEALPKNHSRVINWDTPEREVEVNGRRRKAWSLTFSLNTEIDEYYRRGFGKTAVFTDCHEWSSEEIVRTYNSKYLVEDDFKWLKDRLLICVTPVYHRKDDRIRAHVFSCVMGLVLVRYTAWKLRDLGLTPRKLFEQLERIRVALVQENRTKEATFVVEQMNQVQSRIFSRLGLDRFIVE
jgi:transposase